MYNNLRKDHMPTFIDHSKEDKERAKKLAEAQKLVEDAAKESKADPEPNSRRLVYTVTYLCGDKANAIELKATHHAWQPVGDVDWELAVFDADSLVASFNRDRLICFTVRRGA